MIFQNALQDPIGPVLGIERTFAFAPVASFMVPLLQLFCGRFSECNDSRPDWLQVVALDCTVV